MGQAGFLPLQQDGRAGALQNHFDSKVWRSSTRELVEEKYYTAIVILFALIESSDVEIKKAEEKFSMKAILPAEKC